MILFKYFMILIYSIINRCYAIVSSQVHKGQPLWASPLVTIITEDISSYSPMEYYFLMPFVLPSILLSIIFYGILRYHNLRRAIKHCVTVYSSWILFLRSFFLVPCTWFVPIVTLVLHSFYYLQLISPSIIIIGHLWLGFFFLSIDALGSFITVEALKGTSLFSDVIPFLNQKKGIVLIDYYLAGGWSAFIVGKTAMTSTGRATIFIGLMSGAGWLVNEQFNRMHKSKENEKTHKWQSKENEKIHKWQSEENEKTHKWQSEENEKNREWTSYQESKKAYDSSWSPFKKPPQPPKV